MSVQNIAESIATSLPVTGEVTLTPNGTINAYQAYVGANINAGNDIRVDFYIVDPNLFGPESLNLTGLLTPAFEAAASTLPGASVTLFEMPSNDSTAEPSVFQINVNGETLGWLAVEEIAVAITAASSYDPANIKRIDDVQMDISVVVGRTTLPISDILAWTPGAVVALESSVGDPVEVLVNDVHAFDATVVTLGDDFGIEITRVLDRSGLRRA